MSAKPRFKIDLEVGWTSKYALYVRRRRFLFPDVWELVTRHDDLEKIKEYMESVKDFPKYY